MGSGKQRISDETNSSSDENDGQEQVKSDAGAGKRSYECIYCKRGFTNAQALGDHMNIHRKDRTKTTQLIPGSSSSSTSRKPNMNPNFTGRVKPGQRVNYYPVFETWSYFQQQYISHGNVENRFIQSQGDDQCDEQLWGENSSLRVGSNHNVEDNIGEVSKDELDLELRFGNDHRY